MKTATVRELRNRYRHVLNWVEAGEEVTISKRGKIIARLVPAKPEAGRVDWSRSAALGLSPERSTRLSAARSAALIAESQGFAGS